MGSLKINREALYQIIRRRIEDAWAEVVAQLTEEYLRVIEDPNEFSDLGFNDQDIIDTGRFRDSMTIDVQTKDGEIVVVWDWDPVDPETGEHYASSLYLGFVAGQSYIPGRPWVDRAIKNIDPVQLLQAELSKRGIHARVISNQTTVLMG